MLFGPLIGFGQTPKFLAKVDTTAYIFFTDGALDSFLVDNPTSEILVVAKSDSINLKLPISFYVDDPAVLALKYDRGYMEVVLEILNIPVLITDTVEDLIFKIKALL